MAEDWLDLDSNLTSARATWSKTAAVDRYPCNPPHVSETPQNPCFTIFASSSIPRGSGRRTANHELERDWRSVGSSQTVSKAAPRALLCILEGQGSESLFADRPSSPSSRFALDKQLRRAAMGQQATPEELYTRSEISKIKQVEPALLLTTPQHTPQPTTALPQHLQPADQLENTHRFAPFGVPRSRRLQTFSVFAWTTALPILLGVFFLLWCVRLGVI